MKTVLPLNGRINTDVNPLYLDSQKGEVLSRRNMRVFSADGGKTGINVSIKGMGEYTFDGLVDDEYTAIGSIYDREREQGIVAFYGGSDRHCLAKVSKTGVTSFISTNKSFWNFSLTHPVDMAIIGNNLLMTDNYNPPRMFDIVDVPTLNEYSIQLAKRPPMNAPVWSIGSDSSKKINKMVGKTFQFAYYFIYSDNTTSVLSPASMVAISPTAFSTTTNTYEDSDAGNYVSVSYELGSSNVITSVLVGREGNIGDWFVVEKHTKTGSETTKAVSFYNDIARTPLSISGITSLYSDVPLLAQNILAVQNRACLANVTKGYDQTSPLIAYDVVLEATNISNASSKLNISSGVYDDTQDISDIYISWDIPASLNEGDVIAVSIDGLYYQVHPTGADTIFSFDISYDFSYTVSTGDTQSDVINAFVADINASAGSITTDESTSSPYARYGVDYTVVAGLGLDGRSVGVQFVGAWAKNGVYTPYGRVITGYELSYARSSSFSLTTLGVGANTYMFGSYYQVGICFYDDFGRTSGVLSPERIYIPSNGERDYSDKDYRAKISYSVTNLKAPSWAKYARFAVTESINFSSVYPFVVGNNTGDNIYEITDNNKQAIAILMPDNLGYEFADGDYVQLEKDDGSSITTIIKTVLGTKSSIDVSGTTKSGFWLIVSEGTQTISDYEGLAVTIYRPKNKLEDLVYYEDYNTYPIVSGSIENVSGFIETGDAWIISRVLSYYNGAGTTDVTATVVDFYINNISGIRAFSKGRAIPDISFT